MQEQLADMPFPLNGLELSHGFAMQPELTTRQGVNVRAYEAGTNRARGGSRPGLSRFVPPAVPTLSKLQHLNYVVDPSATALLGNFFLPPGTGFIPDPTGPGPGGVVRIPPGSIVPIGGTGIQPNPQAGLQPPSPSTGIQFSQIGSGTFFGGTDVTPMATASFAHPCTQNSLLLAFVSVGIEAPPPGTEPIANDATVMITDSIGNHYSQIQGYQRITYDNSVTGETSIANSISLWNVTNASSLANTITATVMGGFDDTFFAVVHLYIAEFTGTALSGALFGSSSNSGTSGTMSAGSVAVGGPGEMVCGAFYGTGANASQSGLWSFIGSNIAFNGVFVYQLNLSTAATPQATQANSGVPNVGLDFMGIGASFKPLS